MYTVLGGYLHILGAPSVQSYCILSISVFYRVNPDLFVVVGHGFVDTTFLYVRLAKKW